MKRILPFLLLLVLLCGCEAAKDAENITIFYYPAVELQAQGDLSGFAAESRQDAQDIDRLIAEYLQGPVDPGLYSPFTRQIKLLDCALQDDQLTLQFSDELSQLPSHKMLLACSGLSATIFRATNIKQITFRCESAQINTEDQLVLTPENISWLDSVTTDIITEMDVTQ